MPVRRRIFLNYRQDDTGDAASFLDHVLSFVFGGETVFKASRSIGAGAVFPPAIERAMAETCVALVLVGPRWLDGRRLFRPDDWVRREAAYFLRDDVGIPVIPVLLGGVRGVPPREELPPELATLTERQTVHFRARHTAHDIPGLVRVLHEVAPGLAARHFLRPAQDPPAGHLSSSLLRPEYEVVPFRRREDELGRLAAWRDAAEPLDAEVLVGPAGQGKSRLTVEFCRRSREAGWIAGEPAEGTRAQDLVRLSESGVPTLVVLDRAESAAKEAAGTLSALAGRAAGAAPVRVILVARSMGAWFSELLERSGDAAAPVLLSARTRPLELGGMLRDATEQAEEFRRAAELFAVRLGLPVPPGRSQRTDTPSAPDGHVGSDRILDLHAAALDAVLASAGGAADASADPVVRLLHHEWRDWKRSSVAAELPDPHRERLAVVVAVATLYGGRSEREAYKALAVQLTFRQEQMHVVRRYLRWVSRLYPSGGQAQGAAAPHALRPDRLGEEHVALTVLEQPELIRGVAGELDEAHRERALLVLGRAAPRHPALVSHLAELIESDPAGMVAPALRAAMRLEQPEPVVEALTRSARLHRDLSVARLVLKITPHTEVYATLRAVAARTVLSAERVRSRPDGKTLATTSYQLGLASALAGDHAEALRAARAAVEAYERVPPPPATTAPPMWAFRAARADDRARVRALMLLAYCRTVAGDVTEARHAARQGMERIWSPLRTWPLGATPSDIEADPLRYALSPDEAKTVRALDLFLEKSDVPTAAALLPQLQQLLALKQAGAMLGWVLDGSQASGASGNVTFPPDLSLEGPGSTSVVREEAEKSMRAVRRQISATIRDSFSHFTDAPVEPVPFTEVVAATRAAGIHRWDIADAVVPTKDEDEDDDEAADGAGNGRGVLVGVVAVAVAVGDGDLRALYWDPATTYWVLDSLEVDAYGEFAGVGGTGSPVAGVGAGAQEVVERLLDERPAAG
ncbi:MULTISPECIES: hypothetical protein [Streptomyces]